MVKTHLLNLTQKKKKRSRKNNDNDGKWLYKLMKNVKCGEKLKNLRNRINVKLVYYEKDY